MRWRVRIYCWITFWSCSVDFWDLKIKKNLRSTAAGISTRFTLTIQLNIHPHIFVFVLLLCFRSIFWAQTQSQGRTAMSIIFILILIFALIIVRGLLRASSRTFNHYKASADEVHSVVCNLFTRLSCEKIYCIS